MVLSEGALVVGLLYGSGLRLMEALRLRGKDRLTVLPQSFVPSLQGHLRRVRRLHQIDLATGAGLGHQHHAGTSEPWRFNPTMIYTYGLNGGPLGGTQLPKPDAAD